MKTERIQYLLEVALFMRGYFLLLLLIISISSLSAQQVSLYDRQGRVSAYIDYTQERTIFMWNGTPVAFMEKDGKDLAIFGLMLFFLGWYADGVIYDKAGFIVGVEKEVEGALSIPINVKVEPIKGVQKVTPVYPVTPITPFQPILRSSWSDTTLSDFLYVGKK